LINALGCSCEVGVNLKGFEIADDEQRRVVKFFSIVVKLIIGLSKVLFLALVLPSEVVSKPDIGEPFATSGFTDAFLKSVIFAYGIGFSWMWLA
jgi:hypothetical protein